MEPVALLLLSFTCAFASAQVSSDIPALRAQDSLLEIRLSEAEAVLHTAQKENKQQTAALRAKDDSLACLLDSLAHVQKSEHKAVADTFVATKHTLGRQQSAIEERTLWGAGIAGALVAAIVLCTYYLLRRVRRGTTTIDEVRRIQDRMQEESIQLDNKLIELVERQLADTPRPAGEQKPDHSLALKVADEIVRIELNMRRMDPAVKGYKQLTKAVQRIKDNFSANGYEIVDLLGQTYSEGMKVTASFVADDTLAQGAQIITGITKPQVNYQGTMIQAAQITVSQNI